MWDTQISALPSSPTVSGRFLETAFSPGLVAPKALGLLCAGAGTARSLLGGDRPLTSTGLGSISGAEWPDPKRSGCAGAAEVGHARDSGRAQPRREHAGEGEAYAERIVGYRCGQIGGP
jgi:hypothetical protein